MHEVRVLADDLTGACDVGAELLPWPGGVGVLPAMSTTRPESRGEGLWVHNTQSRTLGAAEAARRVTAALEPDADAAAGVVAKAEIRFGRRSGCQHHGDGRHKAQKL